jgi:hypothetical protein
MSTGINGQKNCGSGKVFLEKVTSIYNVRNTKIDNKKTDTPKNISKLKAIPVIPNKIIAKNTTINATNATSKLTPSVDKKNTKVAVNPISETVADEVIIEKETIPSTTTSQNAIRNQPINLPWVLVGRENKLVKKIITNSKNISIDLFDNGTIDNDTIIVFDNKQLLVNKKRLSYKAIHLEFNFSESLREHEVIIVAHNMGTVPPNTALLLFKDGKNRQEYFITSTNKMNAKLLIVYEPPL